MTDDLDYIKAEAERLPNGTAAKFLAALDAMDGATDFNEPCVYRSEPCGAFGEAGGWCDTHGSGWNWCEHTKTLGGKP